MAVVEAPAALRTVSVYVVLAWMLLNVVLPPEAPATTPFTEAVPPCELYVWFRTTDAPGANVAAAVPLDWKAKLAMLGSGSTATSTFAEVDAPVEF